MSKVKKVVRVEYKYKDSSFDTIFSECNILECELTRNPPGANYADRELWS